MAYVEAHAALRDHPKTKKAARTLKIAPRAVISHLLYLWWWCQDYAQDGNLSACSVEEIAEAADWHGDPNEFVDALINCGRPGEPGFLEIETDDALMVHDWFDYGGKLFKIRAQGAKRQANWRARHAGNVTVTPSNDGKTDSNALLTHHVTQSNAYRGEERDKKEEREAPSSFIPATPSASSGRVLSEKLQAMNEKLSPDLRIPIANVLVDVTGKRALVDSRTPAGDAVFDDAQEQAIVLWKMGVNTETQILELEPKWSEDWRGKKGGSFKQFVEFASQQLSARSNGNGAQPYATAVY